MVTAPLRYCVTPGCPNRVTRGRCQACARPRRLEQRRFQTGQTAYNSARWIRERDAFIADHPFCVNAGKDVRCTLVTEVVDHIVPHRGDEALFWDPQNRQPMCRVCHARKTADEVSLGA